MTKGDISQIIKRLHVMSKKSRAKMKKSPSLALGQLPSKGQIKELNLAAKELSLAAKEMSKVHKAVMRLAAARESAGEKRGKRKEPINFGLNFDAMAINTKREGFWN